MIEPEVHLKLKEVLAKPGEFELMMKDKSGKDVCPVVVKASFEQSETYSESVAAIGRCVLVVEVAKAACWRWRRAGSAVYFGAVMSAVGGVLCGV